MAKFIDTIEYRIPSWALIVIHNGNDGQLTENDEKVLDDFLEDLETQAKCLGADSYTVDVSESEPFFAYENDIQKIGGDVYDVNVTFFKNG